MGEDIVSFLSTRRQEVTYATPENVAFSNEFKSSDAAEKYVFGRNIYAESIAQQIKIAGIIDDFTEEETFLGYPIVRLNEISKNALVLNVTGGRPLTARQRLNEAGLRNLDYFAFCKLSGLPLKQIRFNEGFEEEYGTNRARYEWIYGLLADELSRRTFEKLVNFRFTYDLSYLEGFTQREDAQYFEEFLNLQPTGETFFDVGSYNGFTSLEFVKRCPQYQAIHLFEPDSNNYRICVDAVKGLPNIHCHPIGLSQSKATLKFATQGSRSQISDSGTATIVVDRLDDVLQEKPTFIKMDIEGGELSALEGARETIRNYRPKLAIAAYHAPGDFWRIPREILSIENDCDIYMRHYTECIYETVMFFVPRLGQHLKTL
jgi:FkbM family methyltransferase